MIENPRQLSLDLGDALLMPSATEYHLDELVDGGLGEPWRVDDGFFRPVSRSADPRLLGFLDAMFAVELAMKNDISPEELTLQRSRLVEFYRETKDTPIIKVYGSARDVVWSPQLEDFCDELARLSVETGLSLGNGGGSTGAMGKTTRAWEKHTSARQIQGEETAFRIVLVPLSFFEETFEVPIEGVDAVMAPGSTALQLRTTLLHAVGDTVASAYFPGGLGTAEELVVDLVARQLRGLIDTPHSHRVGLGSTWLINPELVPGAGGFWEPMLKQLEIFVRSGAMNESDLDSIRVLNLQNPREDAALLVESALSCRYTDACRLPTRTGD